MPKVTVYKTKPNMMVYGNSEARKQEFSTPSGVGDLCYRETNLIRFYVSESEHEGL